MGAVAENALRLRAEVDRLAGTPGAVTILGVTKFQPEEKVREAVAAGIRHLGVNYAQDGEALIAAIGESAAEWHFIGHVQSRKVKYLTGYSCLQSLERLEIAQALDRRLTRSLDVLVEVNVGGEAQKSGIAPDALEAFLESVRILPHLKLRGLMAMPPPLEPVSERRPFFQQMRRLYDRFAVTYGFTCLSMGTSEDFRVAIGEGATLVRLGTTLFGPRA